MYPIAYSLPPPQVDRKENNEFEKVICKTKKKIIIHTYNHIWERYSELVKHIS